MIVNRWLTDHADLLQMPSADNFLSGEIEYETANNTIGYKPAINDYGF
jgi:hypothetical protein